MHAFHNLLQQVTSSADHDQMIRFTKPLQDHFRINHFWYYRIRENGAYTYIGTHTEWSEYCFENHLLSQFPILRHPDAQKSGITLMSQSASEEFSIVKQEAWEKFQIHFNLNLTTKIEGGVEAFGFASSSNHPETDANLLSELPLLRTFIQSFRQTNRKLFEVAHANEINLSDYMGTKFHTQDKTSPIPLERETFLKKMGWLPVNPLTPREQDVLKLLEHGYPASYIALQLHLSPRTVENYISIIKSKLYCETRVELIEKARLLASHKRWRL